MAVSAAEKIVMTDQEHQKKPRWFKKRYVPLALLLAFVLWGLWPMLAPRWEQDRCRFGEVTNERYWQMRNEVKEDAVNALKELKASYSMEPAAFLSAYSYDLLEVTKWFPEYTSEKLINISINEKKRYFRGLILSKLISKYTNDLQSLDERIAYMHAIIREIGGWFIFSQKSSYINGLYYGYLIHTGLIKSTFVGFLESLINRYANIDITFSPSTVGLNLKLRKADLYSDPIGLKNTDPYFSDYAGRGCPSSSSFTH